MKDQWEWYRNAISGRPTEHLSDDGTVRSGFFWTKASRAGGRIPVAIWTDGDGEFRCRFGTKDSHRWLTLDDLLPRWPFVLSHPVVRDDYVTAWETGTWPDGSPTKAPDLPAGSNLPTDPFKRLMAEVDDKIESAKATVNRLAAATVTKVDADMARNLQAELLKARKTADALHKAEKQPHLDACREVDDKFRFRDAIDAAAAKLKNIFENFMKAEEARARAEAERKFREEQARAQAERQRIEAERAKKMRDDPIAALTDPEPEPMPELPLAPESVKVNVGGGIGRAAGLKTVWEGQIIDYEATLRHYREHPDVKAVIEKLVKTAVRVGKSETKIPGVKVVEDRRAA